MFYNVYLEDQNKANDYILVLNEEQVMKMVSAFWKGESEIRVKGAIRNINNPKKFLIYSITNGAIGVEQAEIEANINKEKNLVYGGRVTLAMFKAYGTNVSDTFLNGKDWGSEMINDNKTIESRIESALYNIFLKRDLFATFLLAINNSQLEKFLQAYLNGETYVTISGEKYNIHDPAKTIIYKINNPKGHQQIDVRNKLKEIYENDRRSMDEIFFEKIGSDVTHSILGDKEWGSNLARKDVPLTKTGNHLYVQTSRIDELNAISNNDYSLIKLIAMCEELNKSWANEQFFSIGMLVRAIKDHIPPIFNCNNFAEVANNYNGSKSFKKSMQNLQNSLTHIADQYLHEHIRNKEILPTKIQVDFTNDLDVLLGEIVRILK